MIIAILLLFFSILEISPKIQSLEISGKWQVAGGFLSGFFRGLAGIQGAFRSAFLIKSGLSKEAFIATGVIIASLVDITRLSVYASRIMESGLQEKSFTIIIAVCSAIAGTIKGNRLLSKIEFQTVKIFVAMMLMVISAALGLGLI